MKLENHFSAARKKSRMTEMPSEYRYNALDAILVLRNILAKVWTCA